MSPAVSILCFLGCIFISSCSQILLKKSALENRTGIWVYLNFQTVAGYGIFFLVTLCTTYLYKYVSLSLGTLLDSSGYIFVTVLSVLLLQEKVSKRKIFGLCLILAGILISLVL